MAKAKQGIDQYIQFYKQMVPEGFANTGSIKPIITSVSAKDRVGMEIFEVQYSLETGYWTELVGDLDSWSAGLTVLYRGGTVPTEMVDDGVIDWVRVALYHKANGELWYQIEKRNVFPQPILVHPAALWLFCKGLSLANPINVGFKIGYRYVALSDTMYEELFQTVLLQNVI